MAWETRNDRGRYYTRSRRENGGVVREYVGCGRKGELAAAADATTRAEREAERATIRAQRDRAQTIDDEVANLHSTIDLLTRGVLMAAGFERYKRQWRKRRDDPSTDGADRE